MRRTDAERDQQSVAREPRGARDRRREGRLVADQVVGGKHQQHRVALRIGDAERGERNGRRRVAAEGLEQERAS